MQILCKTLCVCRRC